jgi:transcriptional regulator with XRE-family HTH domain
MKNKFSARIETLRGTKTQKDFARLLGVPINTYTNWTRGIRMPNCDALANICTQLGVSADWLLGLSDIREGSRAPPPMPSRGLVAADPRGPEYLTAPAACPECAARQQRIDTLLETLHNLSLGRSTPARSSVSAPGKYCQLDILPPHKG